MLRKGSVSMKFSRIKHEFRDSFAFKIVEKSNAIVNILFEINLPASNLAFSISADDCLFVGILLLA